MTRTAKSRELVAAEPEPFVELHPDDARRAWVHDGELVRVVSRRGAVKLRARFDDDAAPGHRVRPVPLGRAARPRGRGRRQRPHPPRDRPRLAPAGPEGDRGARVRARCDARAAARRARRQARAAHRRRRPRRRRDRRDAARARRLRDHDRHRASPGCPYDRVGLTDHLAGLREASDLPLHNQRWYRERGIALCGAVLDAARRRRDDRQGRDRLRRARARDRVAAVHPADRRASSARSPFRTRHDVRTIRGRTNGARRAVVIGGGLLGLEAARAVANRGIAVTVVHLAGQLMERQLDATAGRMLERALRGPGHRRRLRRDDDRDPRRPRRAEHGRDDPGRPRDRRRRRRPRDRARAPDGRAGRPRHPGRRLAAHEHPRRLGGRRVRRASRRARRARRARAGDGARRGRRHRRHARRVPAGPAPRRA